MIYISIICAATIIINTSNLPWNKHDQQVFEDNQDFCLLRTKNNKCVKKFAKIGDQEYNILYGPYKD